MILELGDGREVKLPDEMADESARLLKRLILGAEERAQVAEHSVRLLRDEMAALRQQMDAVVLQVPDTGAAAAVTALQEELRQGVARIVEASLADRLLVKDEVGNAVRSRAVPR